MATEAPKRLAVCVCVAGGGGGGGVSLQSHMKDKLAYFVCVQVF